jgi:hypothetical protein
MATPLQIITDAMEDLNIIAGGATPDGRNTATGLKHYNRMVGQIAALRLGWYEVNEAFTWTTSQQSYTIGKSGSGANFIMTAGGERPPKIDYAKIVLTTGAPDQEYRIPVITVQRYAAIPQPAQSALQPVVIYYQPTFPNGTLWPVPYPTATTNQLRLFWKSQLATVLIATIAADIPMPPGVQDALTWEMERRLAPAFGLTLTQDQKDMAYTAWQTLLTMKNSDPAYIGTNILGANERTRWNWNPNTLNYY